MKRHNKVTIILLILSILLPLKIQAQVLTAMRDKVKDSYNFWLYSPKEAEEQPNSKLPLIVFLHGKSLSGTDLSKVRRYGPLHALAMGRKIGAYIVAPQTSNGWNSSKVDKVVDYVVDNYPIDTNKIYVIGMSMGGYGTIDYVGTHPDRIAAAMAICGGGDLKDYEPLRKVPLWILHGTADRAVGISESQKVIDGMKLSSAPESENRLIFTKLEGADHSRPGRLLYMPEVYEWLLKHSLSDPGRPVNRDYQISNKSLDGAYSGLRSGQTNFKVVDQK